ncbi:tRNA lysidine(34) synthetase TilS [Spirochaeta isovalerica]|uniref:tRNA(Ile)-lysidine synthase n=1 Tax=Spirochaeta isovalerica TaxID=150 RepID=A0A841R8F9_9SPIO|nr:tRNA lysidine(34) synthetase TilS [Spirochaeta isovalerica]MBB6479018.1 tRNA(Ile)-lysidine synthase [Spirochaeta isovalerica]
MSSTEKNLPEKVLVFLRNHKIEEGTMCLVALSGGPDSTALFRAMVSLRDQLSVGIGAAYVNHGMREKSELDREDQFVRNLSEKYHVPLFVKGIPPGKIKSLSSLEQRSTEEVAREYRYSHFSSVLKQFDKSCLLLGHNLDDQFETIITRFFQGNGTAGLKGIPHRNDPILRPLIHIRKSEILAYLHDIGQDWCFDPSNAESDYLRNKVRNKLVPVLEDIFPGMEKALLKQEKLFTDLDSHFEKKSEEMVIVSENNKVSVDIESFNECNAFVRRKILYRLFDRIFPGDTKGYRLPSGFFHPFLKGSLTSGKVYSRAHGVLIECQAGRLIMRVDEGMERGYFHVISHEQTFVANKYRIRRHFKEGIPLLTVENSPVFFRSAVEGDSIETEQGNRKIKELFRQWGIEMSERSLVPVIEDPLGVVAVLGELAGFRNIHRKKKMNAPEKFNILYLEVGKET